MCSILATLPAATTYHNVLHQVRLNSRWRIIFRRPRLLLRSRLPLPPLLPLTLLLLLLLPLLLLLLLVLPLVARVIAARRVITSLRLLPFRRPERWRRVRLPLRGLRRRRTIGILVRLAPNSDLGHALALLKC